MIFTFIKKIPFKIPLYLYGIYQREKLKRTKNYISSERLNLKNEPYVSIVILTYNALDYIKKCINSLSKTDYKNFEIIIVDNASGENTRKYLKDLKAKGIVDKLHLSRKNNYFAKGNNIGASLCSKKSEYILLLNSDTEIIDPKWLKILVSNVPPKGIISFGWADLPIPRPDGWCFFINRKTYSEESGLNEYYQMNWGITELTGKLLNKKITVRSIINPGKFIIHYGKRSYTKGIFSNKFNQIDPLYFLKLYRKYDTYQVFKIN